MKRILTSILTTLFLFLFGNAECYSAVERNSNWANVVIGSSSKQSSRAILEDIPSGKNRKALTRIYFSVSEFSIYPELFQNGPKISSFLITELPEMIGKKKVFLLLLYSENGVLKRRIFLLNRVMVNLKKGLSGIIFSGRPIDGKNRGLGGKKGISAVTVILLY